MNRSQKEGLYRELPRLRRLMRAITLSLWGAVVLGIIYYFIVVYTPPRGRVHQTDLSSTAEWRDVPIAEVGAQEEYQELEQYGTLYILECDSIWTLDYLEEGVDSISSAEDEAVAPETEKKEKENVKATATSQGAPHESKPKKKAVQSPMRPGVISNWDYLFQQYGEEYGWDWHVLASIAYQESHFRADIVGVGGATGLMGIMPATGRRYGYNRSKLKHAETSIHVACMALRDFGRSFAHITDAEQRMKFTLAAYNAGSAHVLDARRLAERYGHDPDLWDDSVALYMARLDEPKYYKDPLVRHGRAHGDHTVRYVAEVFSRAQSYKMKVQHATAE